MSLIPDSEPLVQMSIPGTHDSAADTCHFCDNNHDKNLDEAWTKCQDMNITEQLESGIRFFDIRVRRVSGNHIHQGDPEPDRQNGWAFAMYHGPVFLRKYFGRDVLKPVMEFLSKYPSEGVLFRMKDEFRAERGAPEAQQIFAGYRTDFAAEQILISDTFKGECNLTTMQDLRGKIRVIKFDDDNCTSKQDVFQMECKLGMIDFGPKKASILKGLQDANNQPTKPFVTFTSGTTLTPQCLYSVSNIFSLLRLHRLTLTNRAVAVVTNPYAMEELRTIQATNGPGVGIVVMDFPSKDHIKSLINFNRGYCCS